eukprot:tig00000042_g15629.t1
MAGLRPAVASAELDEREVTIRFEKFLGRGGFGSVFLADWNRTTVAVKELDAHLFGAGEAGVENAVRDFEQEAQVLSLLNHPNIVRFFGILRKSKRFFLVFEWARGGTMRKYLDRLRADSKRLSDPEALCFALDVASGLKYLASNGILHRDLKGDNVLLSPDPSGQVLMAKISDFGLAKVKNKTMQHSEAPSTIGTVQFQAPERLSAEPAPATEKSDVYSFGAIIWEMVTGEIPWKGKDVSFFFHSVGTGRAALKIPTHCHPVLQEVMRGCLAFDPEQRPTIDEVHARLRAAASAVPPPAVSPNSGGGSSSSTFSGTGFPGYTTNSTFSPFGTSSGYPTAGYPSSGPASTSQPSDPSAFYVSDPRAYHQQAAAAAQGGGPGPGPGSAAPEDPSAYQAMYVQPGGAPNGVPGATAGAPGPGFGPAASAPPAESPTHTRSRSAPYPVPEDEQGAFYVDNPRAAAAAAAASFSASVAAAAAPSPARPYGGTSPLQAGIHGSSSVPAFGHRRASTPEADRYPESDTSPPRVWGGHHHPSASPQHQNLDSSFSVGAEGQPSMSHSQSVGALASASSSLREKSAARLAAMRRSKQSNSGELAQPFPSPRDAGAPLSARQHASTSPAIAEATAESLAAISVFNADPPGSSAAAAAAAGPSSSSPSPPSSSHGPAPHPHPHAQHHPHPAAAAAAGPTPPSSGPPSAPSSSGEISPGGAPPPIAPMQPPVKIYRTPSFPPRSPRGRSPRGGAPTGGNSYIVDGSERGPPPPPSKDQPPVFRRIDEALMVAKAGDRIFVKPGRYDESLIVNNDIHIEGTGTRPSDVLICAEGKFALTALHCKGSLKNVALFSSRSTKGGAAMNGFYTVKLQGGAFLLEACEVKGEGLACVAVCGAGSSVVRSCEVTGTADIGLYLYDQQTATVENCDVHHLPGTGIKVENSASRVAQNRVHDCGCEGVVVAFEPRQGRAVCDANEIYDCDGPGIQVSLASPLITNNTLHHCGIGQGHVGVMMAGSSMQGSSGVILTGGSAELKENEIFSCGDCGVQVEEQAQVTLSGDKLRENRSSGFRCFRSTSARLSGVEISQNGDAGVAIFGDARVVLEKSTVRGNKVCNVYAKDRASVTLRGNEITGSTENAVVFRDGSDGIIEDNTIADNAGHGVVIAESNVWVKESNRFERNKGSNIHRLSDRTTPYGRAAYSGVS